MTIARTLAAAAAAALLLAAGGAAPAAAAPADRPDHTPIRKPVPGYGKRALAGPNYHYAEGIKDITTSTGTGATQVAVLASQHKPHKPSDTFHSLWELAALDPYSPGGLNAAEIGWSVDLAVNGDVNTHLFCYAWANGTGLGYNAAAGVDNPNEAVGCGTALATTPPGAAPSNYYQYRVERTPAARPAWQNQGPGWQLIQQNMGNTPDRIVHYYPDTEWTSRGTVFTRIPQMRSFWELASLEAKPKACGDMGAGVYGTSASPSAAADSLAFSFAGAAGTNDFDVVDVSPAGDSPTAWRVYDQGTAATPDPDRIRGGGPGWNAAGTGAGTVGAC